MFVWVIVCMMLYSTFFHDFVLCSSEISETFSSGASGSGGADDPNKNLPSIPEDGIENGNTFLEWLLNLLNQNRVALGHVVGDNGTFVIFCLGGTFIVVVSGVAIVSGSVLVLDRVGEYFYDQGLFRTAQSFSENVERFTTASEKIGTASERIGVSASHFGTLAQWAGQQDGFVIGCIFGGALVIVAIRPSLLLHFRR
jgi:hypothetical protein